MSHEPRIELTTGEPVPADYSHTKLKLNGQQEGYVVLSPAERAKGFVRPVRDEYTHLPCKMHTFMGRALAETYARDPKFYDGTFCAHCRKHFPLDQFVWKNTNEKLGS